LSGRLIHSSFPPDEVSAQYSAALKVKGLDKYAGDENSMRKIENGSNTGAAS
jgi:hypothetical protein